MKNSQLFRFLALTLGVFGSIALPPDSRSAEQAKPHAVFVIGTPHYSPEKSLPPLAQQLEENGFRCTVVTPQGNPEKNAAGIPGLEVLNNADVAIFYLRFLTLPDDQLSHIQKYLESGKPVVGFRTSTHAFSYAANDPKSKWNDGFGKDALGSKYFIHGKGGTVVKPADTAKDHPVLAGVDFSKFGMANGTLYLSDVPDNATVLIRGTGNFSRTGKVTNAFGTHEIRSEMTDDIAWVWENRWGGRVFCTTMGHPATFANEEFVRLCINGIAWAHGGPVPGLEAKVKPIEITERPKDRAQRRKAKEESNKSEAGKNPKVEDAKNRATNNPAPEEDPDFARYGIYEKTAPRPGKAQPIDTSLPLKLEKGARIAFIGNTLLDREKEFGHFEARLHAAHPDLKLVVRNLCWPADTITVQPRPTNFADVDQHLTHEKADVIIAAFGYNESFAGPDGLPAFRKELTTYLNGLKAKAFNGRSGPQIVLVSPIANENISTVAAGDRNNANIKAYTGTMKAVAAEVGVGFADVYTETEKAMADKANNLTINGAHLNETGYALLGRVLFQQVFGEAPAAEPGEDLRLEIIDKNRQYFRRYRPVNSFYYTGSRNKSYGYLDFLPAMRNFEIMVDNRDKRIWQMAAGETVAAKADDSNVPPLPPSKESRGANEWMTAKDELAAFKIDPRFDVTLFAGEEEFPDIACPIQMRWDSKGRLWVSCSTTYPHVYPGNEPNDKIVILEDTDGDGKADKSSVFADDLHIPLSFEFGDGGLYVSEEPHMTFIKDTDGDGKADYRRILLTGFGCEDSHHALHDFVWSPDGDLIFRESIFHHSQIETPYGPVRQNNSGWFRYEPRHERLTSFGTYHSTNPWGVTFDDWGQHVASHPIFASAFHALDPVYPEQHPKPAGLKAYSGTCGQEFVDVPFWPKEMQGGFLKARYKPTNRIEFLKWNETDFGYEEEYVSDVIFSTNLSFIPVDLRYGPDGAMYVCDWYNPVKGHAQYSLRDPRRDRESGRIWRIMPKGAEPAPVPDIAGSSVVQLLDMLKRPESRLRYRVRRELRERDAAEVEEALNSWVKGLDPKDPRFTHHQVEAMWVYRGVDRTNTALLFELLNCDNHHARAAATRMLRYWHEELKNGDLALRARANDENGLVRLEAAIAASYIGTEEALDAMLDTLKHPNDSHLRYAIRTSLGSNSLKPLWFGNEKLNAARPELGQFLTAFNKGQKLQPPPSSAKDSQFDSQKDLKVVRISCIKERMLYTEEKFTVKPGQPVKLVFSNPDATQHNLVIVEPGAMEEIGLAGNEMAKDPDGAKKHFVPKSDKILHYTKLLDPETVEVMRFHAPEKPGVYPYLCTFPGHWVIMKGEMVVK